ncbi:transmembrane protein 101-like [Gigantopelta aegis]|uniref:transmembrane protein 101-like n=1 Tax=Gigantopelta aegis TaxID=1735272 RepID=UPI001B88BBC9|nr:transmembrane protein 101-like [Gigantopelta aegis]
MAMSTNSNFRYVVLKITLFLLEKFPFFNALTLLMLLAERAAHESYPPINPKLVYINLVLFVGCGFLLSAKSFVKQASLIYAGQLLYFAFSYYTNSKFSYGHWQRIHMATRQIGCAGIYILLADLLVKADQGRYRVQADGMVPSRQQQRIGEILIGLYLFSYSCLLTSCGEHREAFLHHFWHSELMQYAMTAILLASAFCFISGYFVKDMFICVIPALILLTALIDCDIRYWTERQVHYWNQVRLLGDNVCAISGFIFFASVSYSTIT